MSGWRLGGIKASAHVPEGTRRRLLMSAESAV